MLLLQGRTEILFTRIEEEGEREIDRGKKEINER